ncbi:hypothetical protein A8B75_18515 [Sphingomonadales bacterium EhC05]|nr:hypothetical protein A8B75_18515 [Sphingomonadales bacterium EhC05]
MITLRTAAAVKSTIELLADNQLRALLTERVEQLTNAWEGIDLSDLTHFLIIQPGNTAAEAENELGWSLLVNMVDGTRYDHLGFTPSWEWIEDHGGWFEAVFILSDDGFGVSLFVQDHPVTDADLLAMCREHAQTSAHNGERNKT